LGLEVCSTLLPFEGCESVDVRPLAVSTVLFVSRSTKSEFISRIRPKYKEIPEPTLNATLKDVHDLVQYLVVEAQKIAYGENLGKTFGVSLRKNISFPKRIID
jgi:hypothetical protein